MNKAYYAIIPADVRYDKTLTPNAKLLYGEITALCNKEGFCWAENGYFSELYGKSNVSISKWISSLEKAGYVKVELNKKDGNKRKIYITKVNDLLKKSLRGHKEKLKTPIKEKFKSYKENSNKSNITSNNIIAKNEFLQNINPLLNKFQEINPTINYGNKTQRLALQELIEKFGEQKVTGLIDYVVSIHGENYAPTITTPLALKNKLGDLLAYMKKQEGKKIFNNVIKL